MCAHILEVSDSAEAYLISSPLGLEQMFNVVDKAKFRPGERASVELIRLSGENSIFFAHCPLQLAKKIKPELWHFGVVVDLREQFL